VKGGKMETIGFKRSLKTNLNNTFLNILTFVMVLASIIFFAFSHILLTAIVLAIFLPALRIGMILEDTGNYICPFCKKVIEYSHIHKNCIWCNALLP